ncbi:hypothetical protein RCC89_00295 [Cytophagaceae bacterium ABcell3]|nr:hypothetical protein RCC89_00295 [Cytophagaceae bacterium ABcell3]
MGKRLTRIKASELVQKSSEVINKECDIVCYGNRTFHGIITDLNSHVLYFKNMFQKQSEIKLEHIEEIILDNESAW